MKRFISPEEIASGVAYLSANEASAITGEHLSVSGGM
jgi:3-hydroxybutyrate dehydrogenase